MSLETSPTFHGKGQQSMRCSAWDQGHFALSQEETKEQFCKRAVLANMCPRSSSWIQEYQITAFFCKGSTAGEDFSEEISVQGTICQNHPFGNHPFANPRRLCKSEKLEKAVAVDFKRLCTEGWDKVHGSVDRRFAAGLPFPVPAILEFRALNFRDSGRFCPGSRSSLRELPKRPQKQP